MSSTLIMRFFWQKKQETSNVGKNRNYDEERVFFREKNVLIFQKAFFTKMGGGGAQNMPVVAGRFVKKNSKNLAATS